MLDTIGVAMAGLIEPVALSVLRTLGSGSTPLDPWSLGPSDLSLVLGAAAHALDYDDMCFVSLAHPSAPLVPAIIATGRSARASGRALLDAYVIGFEIQARLGAVMNPRHYQRGWHCTSTLGAISAAAGASRLLGLDAARTAHALAIAASSASGLKENFGTMVKPLHAGLAARDGVLAAMLARDGLTASAKAFDGDQGFLRAFDSEGGAEDFARATGDLGSRWEILDTGITVKLYPSCAGTHPTLDAVLDLRSQHGFNVKEVERIDVDVDPIVPTILIHNRPATALEAKFSMPFSVAAAVVHGRVGIDTFEDAQLQNPNIAALVPHVRMRVDPEIGKGKPSLTEARVQVHLKDGRSLTRDAHGARGYPANPASDAELDAKFIACASRALPAEQTRRALTALCAIDQAADVAAVVNSLAQVN